MFKLKRPCRNCPFRTDVPGYLRRGRTIEIATSIANGAMFPCHETTIDDLDSDEGENMIGPDSQFCAGALLVMENEGHLNQLARIGERLGYYDAAKMDRTAPVVASFRAFIDHHGEDDDKLVPCPACGEPVCGSLLHQRRHL